LIVYPKNWKTVGQKITLKQIEDTIRIVLEEIDCQCLALSGGIDSSLLLYFMRQLYFTEKIKCFTIACSKNHPDYIFSNLVCRHLKIENEIYIPDSKLISEDIQGDNIVEAFYEYLDKKGIKRIIAGDGVDEFNCGYYDHLHDPSEKTYYDYIRRLQKEQLEPLNKNSGNIEVCLPYIDDRLILLFSQIPIFDKVDNVNRKKILIELAIGKLPGEIIYRRKYGFCDAMKIK